MPYVVRGRASIRQQISDCGEGNHLAEPWTKIHAHPRKRFLTEQKSLNRPTPSLNINAIASITTLLPTYSAPGEKCGLGRTLGNQDESASAAEGRLTEHT